MIKNLTVLTAFAVLSNYGYSQECGTIATPKQIKYLDKSKDLRQNYVAYKSKAATTQVPIQIHIARRSNGTGGLTTAQITTMINDMNAYYANVNMEFFQCKAINYIDDNSHYDFNSANENTVAGANDVTNVINIYFFNSISSGGFSLCGYTRFPPSTDRIFMDNSCALNGEYYVT